MYPVFCLDYRGGATSKRAVPLLNDPSPVYGLVYIYCSMLTGVPPFELALPSREQRCRVIAVEERLGELLSVWKLPLSPEVSR